MTLKSIEILTIFLKDEETPGGGPSQAHIRFEGVKSMKPGEKTVLSHRTWINGKPVDTDHDQMERLKLRAGQANPYALEISVGGCGRQDAFSTDTSRQLSRDEEGLSQ